jgi:two-component sensor histidine kinase
LFLLRAGKIGRYIPDGGCRIGRTEQGQPMGWPRLSLRGRLLVLTFVAFAPAVALLAWTEFQLRQARETEIRQLALRYGQLASLELVRIVGGIDSLLKATAHVPAVAAREPGACRAYLAAVVTDAPQLRAVTVLDGAARPQCASTAIVPSLSARNRALLAAPTTPGQGSLIVGVYQDGGQTGGAAAAALLPLLMPMRDADGRSAGTMVAYLDLAWLGARIKERTLGTGNSLTIADRDGIIIAREPFPKRFIGTRIPSAFDYIVHGDAPGTLPVISQDGTRRMLGYYPVNTPPVGIYLSAGISEPEAFRDIDATRRRNLAAMLVAGVATFALAWTIGQRFIQRPVQRLLASIEAWRRDDMAVRTGMRANSGELEAVGEAFDGLIDELARRQTAREHAEAQRNLLMEELRHRVKNTLTVVQAIAVQSLRGGGDLSDARASFTARLQALADAHDILIANSWEAAELTDVLVRTLRPFQEATRDRFAMSGPGLLLQPAAALSLGLAVHELATNAVKYGALAQDGGQVRIAWHTEGQGADSRFYLHWRERGGPPVAAPARTGFGSRLIRGALGGDMHGTVRMAFDPEGLDCRIEAPLRSVAAERAES